jgi:hypothetical protein
MLVLEEPVSTEGIGYLLRKNGAGQSGHYGPLYPPAVARSNFAGRK